MLAQTTKLFNAVVVKKSAKVSKPNFDLLKHGVVTDFIPTPQQSFVLRHLFEPLNITTLFSVKERENSTAEELIAKQILHYFEVYGLNSPGTFDLEVTKGKVTTLKFINGITKKELGVMVRELLEANAPIKDTTELKALIDFYKIDYDVNKIANNEMRVVFFDESKDTFTNGDDAVRWMCYKATEKALLIKSTEVIAAVKQVKFSAEFFERHIMQLAQVFNRHKKLILAAKNKHTNTIINKITRTSKYAHVPLRESIAKRYVSGALKGQIDVSALEKVSIRDHFKFLNLLDFKREQKTTDAFIIRNGKIHVATDRKVWSVDDINRVEKDVLLSLKSALANLNNKTILLDANIQYGLPVSRKQTVGHLPFGTRVKVNGDTISAGIHWRNEWGASDLDLSSVNESGKRVGWGQYNSYSDKSVVFSGDVTNADDGAMEFFTSSDADYGLLVNIYDGAPNAEAELIVGHKTKSKWIGDCIIREKTTLRSKGSILGFVKKSDFIVYQGSIGNHHTSSERDAAVTERGAANFWTVNRLFDAIGVKYSVDKKDGVVYDNDITYAGFSYDKLEELLL